MVSKITIFEPHFDGAQFGPASIEAASGGTHGSENSSDNESGSKSPLVMFFQGGTVFVVLFVVLWVVLSHLLSTDEESAS